MKKYVSILLATLLLAGLAGCGSTGGQSTPSQAPAPATEGGEAAPEELEPSAEADPVHLQFMHGMVQQERQDIIQRLIDDFTAENPHVTIEQVPTDDSNYDTKITALTNSGELPAIVEVNQNRAKLLAKNELVDHDAVREVIETRSASPYYDAILQVNTTEDGGSYIGVPVGGWVQGIWYNKTRFDEMGLAAPDTWENILAAAQAFYNPAERQYGIALPTVEAAYSEQSFSQFALSNGANVLDADGNVSFDTPEMVEALAFYKELYQYTMPGSNDTTEVRDAFLNGSAPMCIYSTYILSALAEAGISEDVAIALPTNKSSASFGNVGMLTISADLGEAERQATIDFLSFVISDQGNTRWLHMAPGGQQPLFESVATSPAYLDNEVIASFSHIAADVSGAFDNIQMFGIVEGKNFFDMGDITSSGLISKAVNSVTVKDEDPAAVAERTQREIEAIIG